MNGLEIVQKAQKELLFSIAKKIGLNDLRKSYEAAEIELESKSEERFRYAESMRNHFGWSNTGRINDPYTIEMAATDPAFRKLLADEWALDVIYAAYRDELEKRHGDD